MTDFSILIEVKNDELDVKTNGITVVEAVGWMRLAELEIIRTAGFFTDEQNTAEEVNEYPV
jgi:hypothetical protein